MSQPNQADLEVYLKAAFIAGGKAVDNIYLDDLCTQISRIVTYFKACSLGNNFTYHFASPEASWGLNHNLGTRMIIPHFWDESYNPIEGVYVPDDENNGHVDWIEAQAGYVFLEGVSV